MRQGHVMQGHTQGLTTRRTLCALVHNLLMRRSTSIMVEQALTPAKVGSGCWGVVIENVVGPWLTAALLMDPDFETFSYVIARERCCKAKCTDDTRQFRPWSPTCTSIDGFCFGCNDVCLNESS